jgi:hypothetical protein
MTLYIQNTNKSLYKSIYIDRYIGFPAKSTACTPYICVRLHGAEQPKTQPYISFRARLVVTLKNQEHTKTHRVGACMPSPHSTPTAPQAHAQGSQIKQRHTHNSRVGQNRIYTPYTTVHLLFSLPKIPYMHRIYLVLANPTQHPTSHTRSHCAIHIARLNHHTHTNSDHTAHHKNTAAHPAGACPLHSHSCACVRERPWPLHASPP